MYCYGMVNQSKRIWNVVFHPSFDCISMKAYNRISFNKMIIKKINKKMNRIHSSKSNTLLSSTVRYYR